MVKETRYLIIVKDNCFGESPEGVICEEIITGLIEADEKLEVETILKIGKSIIGSEETG